MSTGAIINLILSVGSVTLLFGWCLWRLLQAPPTTKDHLAHIEPLDEDTAAHR
jgi:hypothetical protein